MNNTKTIALLLLVPLLAASCVTSADIRAVADQLDRVEVAAADESKSAEEVSAEVKAAQEAIRDIAAEVEDRTTGFIDGIDKGTQGGVIGIASMIGLHLYRNASRKKTVVMKDGAA